VDWNEVSFVTGNKVRFAVLISLKKEVRTPTAISYETNFPLSHISTALRELRAKGYVACLSPLAKKNRYYAITEKGSELLNFIIARIEDT
jgi:predicted transcriptional regulator